MIDPEFQMIATNGIKLRAHVEGEGPLVIMVHGFPEGWYCWRNQIKPIAKAGYTVAAVDVRGYGGSDKPPAVLDYTMEKIADDIAGVVAALGHDSAILIGHDWGAPIVYNTSLLYPDRISAVAGLSVPYMGRANQPFIDLAHKVYTEKGHFFYQVYFQEEGVAEAELDRDPAETMRRCYHMWSAAGANNMPKKPHGAGLFEGTEDPGKAPDWLGEDVLAYCAEEFRRAGYRGALNRYRTQREDFAFLEKLLSHTISQPSLFIAGSEEPVLKMIPGMDMTERLKANASDLRGVHIIDGAGHWVQQEKPAEVTAHLLAWLKEI